MSVAMDISGVAGGDGAAGGDRKRTATRVGGARRQVDPTRPGGRPLSYETARIRVSRAPHERGVEDVGWSTVVVGMIATALVVAGLFGIAQLRSGGTVPARTDVVQVREGESLTDIAGRVVPDAPASRVVARIVELNALSGSGLHPGQSLIVPVSTVG
ncbi:LysM peptidoglycan-binding domain-containing protein [Rhodococcus sp. NPDC003318]|uniref:LysM peptidoglycan-binding domain-containing protein n=1 Tax=Rhodococcus sp. NPDC003318 TaxID=3364503 RepID=UPI0036C59C95